MAKNRMVRPEIWTDEKFVVLDPLARLLFMGMWNFACDNGHLDDSGLQLKMRVLPADSCDVVGLLESLIDSGMVLRRDGYLKVVNLAAKQPLDLRFLVFCDHCSEDPDTRYSPEDKKGSRGTHASSTRAAHESTPGAPRSVDGVGGVDGDGVGGGDVAVKPQKRAPETAIPDDWRPSEKHLEFAATHRIDLEKTAFRFRNNALGNDRRQRNWNAAFSTWLSKELDFNPPKPKRDPRLGEAYR